MSLANPILFWSLLGLSVPIAIHLLSRKEGQIIRLGSIRHVHETSTQQFKGIKLNELLLLVLRSAAIFVFCLLLSGLRCAGVPNQKWVLIEAGFENNSFVKSILDSLKRDGYQQRHLCEEFPETRCDSVSQINYWALLPRLEERNVAHVVVLASNKVENFRGKRISLPPHIKWLAIPLDKHDFSVDAIKLNSDSVYIRTGHSSANRTSFTTEKTKAVPESMRVSAPDSIRITIVADDKYAYGKKILIASLKAIQKNFPVAMAIVESSPASFQSGKADWVICLSDSKITMNEWKSAILLSPKFSTNIIERIGRREWIFTKRLNKEVALDQNLALELAHVIIPSKKQQDIALANDRRIMPDSTAWSFIAPSMPAGVITTDANRLLIAFLIALLLAERVIAYRRNQ